MRRDTLTVRARYVFPVEGPPIADGCLTIAGPADRLAGPGRASGDADLDLGNVAIVPGLRQRPHASRAGAARGATATVARPRTSCPGSGG